MLEMFHVGKKHIENVKVFHEILVNLKVVKVYAFQMLNLIFKLNPLI